MKFRHTNLIQNINLGLVTEVFTTLENAEAAAEYLKTPGITVLGGLNKHPEPIDKGLYEADEVHVVTVSYYNTPATPLNIAANIGYANIVNATPGVDQFKRIHAVGSSTFVESFKTTTLTDLVTAIINIPVNSGALGDLATAFGGTVLSLIIGSGDTDKDTLLAGLDSILTPWSSLTSEQQTAWTAIGLTQTTWDPPVFGFSTGKDLLVNFACQGQVGRLHHVLMAPTP